VALVAVKSDAAVAAPAAVELDVVVVVPAVAEAIVVAAVTTAAITQRAVAVHHSEINTSQPHFPVGLFPAISA